MPALAALTFALATALMCTRLIEDWRERACFAWLSLSTALYLTAQAASLAGALGEPVIWLGGGLVFAAVAFYVPRAPDKRSRPKRRSPRELLPWLPLAAIVLLVFAHGISRAPGNWDGVSYHLPRALYYLQFGSFENFPAATPTQVFHPLLGPVWNVAVLTLGPATERLFFVPGWIAWLILALACLAFTDRLEKPGAHPGRRAWLVLVLALLPGASLLGASTEKNDLLVAAYGACAFLFAASPARLSGLLSLLAFSLALAVKASILPLLPLWALAFLWFRRARRDSRVSLLAAATLSLAIVGLAGYGRNFAAYGHWMGPGELVSAYSFRSAGEALSEGSLNVLRYAVDAGTPDGWPGLAPADLAVRAWRRAGDTVATTIFGRGLGSGRTHEGFPVDRRGIAHEDVTGFGLAYFLLLLALLARFTLARKKKKKMLLALLGGATFVFLFHCFAAVYDQWHARFFLVSTIFLAPFLALVAEPWLADHRGRLLLGALFALLFLQSGWSLVFRTNSPLFHPGTRLEQVLRDRPEFREAVAALDREVPEHVMMATRLPFDQPEYAFFGRGLGRTLVPTVDFRRGLFGLEALPESVGWLLYHARLEKPEPGDLELGAGLHLRRLAGAAE